MIRGEVMRLPRAQHVAAAAATGDFSALTLPLTAAITQRSTQVNHRGIGTCHPIADIALTACFAVPMTTAKTEILAVV